MTRSPPRIVCGLATYRQDRAVLELAARAAVPAARQLFTNVVIVDSEAGGELQLELERRGLTPFVRYHGFRRNLGAAGNLHYRLLLAAGLGADFLFALNHDGHLDLEVVEKLARFAHAGEYGAVYPLRRVAPDLYDLTGTRPFPLRPRRLRRQRLPAVASLPAHWSSSNGALYSLRPTWSGLRPPNGLWMGFEDYGWGLTLERAGHRQAILLDAELDSGYDYRSVHLLGSERHLADKPPWLTYYLSRNLLLLSTRCFPSARLSLLAVARILREVLVSALLRPQPLWRLRLLARGMVDGLMGRTGLVIRPPDDPDP
jgi:hypothetical protein